MRPSRRPSYPENRPDAHAIMPVANGWDDAIRDIELKLPFAIKFLYVPIRGCRPAAGMGETKWV
jgi:hypothetical protein